MLIWPPTGTPNLLRAGIDVTWCGTAVCPGMQAEVYACNTAHPNQEFNLNKAGGLEAQFKPGYCLDVCA